MDKQNEIKLFESKKIRSHWDAQAEKWYLSIVDVIVVLTDQKNYRHYTASKFKLGNCSAVLKN